MLRPTLQNPLNELAQVVARINEQSETLNGTIGEFERQLLDVNPGTAFWLNPNSPLLLEHPNSPTTSAGTCLGFLKHKDKWGLWLLRARFSRTPKNTWDQVPGDPTIIPLTDGTRQERVAA